MHHSSEENRMNQDFENPTPNSDRSSPPFASSEEWVPTWLRKRRAIPMSIYCLVFLAALEIIDATIKSNHGIVADGSHKNSVNGVKYVPAVAAIVLGMGWKALLSDTKAILPWSKMSGNWVSSSESVLMDYVSRLEILSLFSSFRRRHWSVAIGLVVGFVCGALIAVSNSLVRIDLFASISQEVAFTQTSQFNLANGLQNPNGSLTIPSNYLGEQPYAAVAAQQLPNGIFPPWTIDNLIFESFTPKTTLKGNQTLESKVMSLRSGLTCSRLQYQQLEAQFSTFLHIKADASDMEAANCPSLLKQEIEYQPSEDADILGWLNVTSCSKDPGDTRIIANLAKPKKTTTATGFDVTLDAIGLICSPHLFLQPARIRVNTTTNEIMSYAFDSGDSASPTHIPGSNSALYYMYLNNPLDGRSQDVYQPKLIADQAIKPIANLGNATAAAAAFVQNGIDPFFAALTDGQADTVVVEYLKDFSLFQSDVESLSGRMMAQVFNSFARSPADVNIDGTVQTIQARLFLRQPSLRVLQALLACVAIAGLLQTTIVRPKSLLKESPGTIASMAVTLAASASQVEEIFANEMVSSDSSLIKTLKSSIWRLNTNDKGSVMLESKQQEVLGQDSTASEKEEDPKHGHAGYKPISLQLWAKALTLIALIGIIVALAVLLRISQDKDGLSDNTTRASEAFSFVPTTVFILLGYACSGIDASVRTISPYKSLQTSSKKQPLLSDLDGTPSIWVPFRTMKDSPGLAVILSSLVMLLIPAIQAVAAGLYTQKLVSSTLALDPQIDDSLMTSLESTFSLANLESNVQRASQFAEWAMIPSFDVPRRSGIVENLVFGNITSLGSDVHNVDLSGSRIDLNAPAIAVDVKCSTVSVGIQAVLSDGSWSMSFKCHDDVCKSRLDTDLKQDCRGIKLGYGEVGFVQLPTATAGETSRFQGTTFLTCHNEFQVFLADFTSIQDPIKNIEPVPIKHFGPTVGATVWANPGMFNTSLPTLRAVSCSLNLREVSVDASFTQVGSTASNIPATNLPWSPVSFNASTIKFQRQYNGTKFPTWLAPIPEAKFGDSINQYDASTNTPGQIQGNSLFPRTPSPANFFELLAVYSTHKLGNASAILDPDTFTKAVEAMYTAYTTEMLTEMRPRAKSAASGAFHSVPARMTVLRERIVQDEASTIAVVAILAVMCLCLLWVFVRFPSESILPKDPGTIAARASFLARSRLVERLRQENVGSVSESRVWDEKAGLGWWDVSEDGEKSGGAKGRKRWGIDVGEGVVHRSWGRPPDDTP